MTTPARQQEAQEASVAFQVAMTYIGAEMAKDALAEWVSVPQTNSATAAARWLSRTISTVMFRRRQARELALAYYRLVRALHVGITIANPYKPDQGPVTYGSLRQDFVTQVATWTGHTPELTHADDGEAVDVEELPGLKEDLDAIEAEAEQIGTQTLKAVGPDSLAKKVEKIKTDQPAKDVDAKRQEAHATAGARQAGDAARNAMNGARGTVYNIGKKDPKAIGWVRVSKTGTPCAFCAMLISRGFVLYATKYSAMHEEGDEFHTNCQCIAEPVYSRQQYDSDSRFDLNRELDHLWQNGHSDTGLPANPSLQVWRAWWDKHRKPQTNETPAQAA